RMSRTGLTRAAGGVIIPATSEGELESAVVEAASCRGERPRRRTRNASSARRLRAAEERGAGRAAAQLAAAACGPRTPGAASDAPPCRCLPLARRERGALAPEPALDALAPRPSRRLGRRGLDHAPAARPARRGRRRLAPGRGARAPARAGTGRRHRRAR